MVWGNGKTSKMPSTVIPFIAGVCYFIEHLASGFRQTVIDDEHL